MRIAVVPPSRPSRVGLPYSFSPREISPAKSDAWSSWPSSTQSDSWRRREMEAISLSGDDLHPGNLINYYCIAYHCSPRSTRCFCWPVLPQ
ncbi:hypothetical protein V8F44DRAFT_369536 [Aspergillus fumigatus]